MRSMRVVFSVCMTLLIALGAVMVTPASAESQQTNRPSDTIRLTPFDAVAECFPYAEVNIRLIENNRGIDRLFLQASNLPPRTEFTLFLTETPGLPFGAAQYLSSFTTNRAGWAQARVTTEVRDAFASTIVGEERVRVELDNIVIWFADPADDDGCLGAGEGPITPFDIDGEAGIGIVQSVEPENPLAR
ncbi:MAG: hypothetical protein AAGF95_22700 [Chloroflexota bacterium]